MKLKSTLSGREGMLYTAPLMDVILLLIIFFLFGSNLVLRSGISVNLPASDSALPSAEDAHIITLIPGESSDFFFNDQRVDLETFPEILEEVRKRSNEVILLGDETVDYGEVMAISRLFLKNGFELSFATQEP
ncbi:MAG: biopolymer transporter ExbD, partial [Verrucomicrobiota bacterium]